MRACEIIHGHARMGWVRACGSLHCRCKIRRRDRRRERLLSPPLTAPAVAAPLSAPATLQEEMPPVVALGGGMVAGALGSVITMPFDVLKTKMQGLGASK